jgi:hypothetical protein
MELPWKRSCAAPLPKVVTATKYTQRVALAPQPVAAAPSSASVPLRRPPKVHLAVAAVGRGEFEVHVVSRVEEALALLTGLPAAEVLERVRLRLSRFRKIAGLRN